MAPRKTNPLENRPTPREAAEYTQGMLVVLEQMAKANSQPVLAHLLDLARREAEWLSRLK